jgi:hypothetical protein
VTGAHDRSTRYEQWLVGPPPLVRLLGWCEPAEGGVRSVGVVLDPSVSDEYLGFEQRVELLDERASRSSRMRMP